MIRRLALLLALLVPATGLAQATGEVVVNPSYFGRVSCASTDPVTISWISLFAPVLTPTTDFFRILVSDRSGCGASTNTATLVDSVTASGNTPQRYSTTAPAFFPLAGVTSCTASGATIYVCVQHWPQGGGGSTDTPKWTGIATVILEVADPPVPTGLSVQPGESSLRLTWSDGTSTGVAAYRWEATAVGSTGTLTQTFSARDNQKFTGLTNGVEYTVTVVAISQGGNRSVPSAAATGTPLPVQSFWDQYQAADGVEQGGCDGGPAGLVSLLGVALALRRLRRRP